MNQKGKKTSLDQCALGWRSQCQSVTESQVFQTCTNETSVAFTPMKIKKKINRTGLI